MLSKADIEVMAKAGLAEEMQRTGMKLSWEELTPVARQAWIGLMIAGVRAIGLKVREGE